MKILPTLNPGDSVEIIAPASRCTDQQLQAMKHLLESWQLHCLVSETIFGEDLLCANTDAARFTHLKNALLNTDTKAVICARGGYGGMRLLPALSKVEAPRNAKLFVGMSDATALLLFLQQRWQWPVIHGACAPDRFSSASIAALKALLFGEVGEAVFTGLMPLNAHAKQPHVIEANVTGGNLTLIQASLGTFWQMDGRGRIILLEEIGERGYRVDRMLEHLRQAGLFKEVAAILIGDFLKDEEPDGSSLSESVLNRFAEQCSFPVVRVKGIGHGETNFPIPLGRPATLQLGRDITLSCSR